MQDDVGGGNVAAARHPVESTPVSTAVAEKGYTAAHPPPRAPRPTPMPGTPAPLFLLADSQLLFAPEVARRIAAAAPVEAPRAAYLGASNGDLPEFYTLFLAAMEPLGSGARAAVGARPSADALRFLEGAEVVVLAGGDVERGWRAFEHGGVRERVAERRAAGAVLVGVSAGAVQLGAAGWPEGAPAGAFDCWGFAPFVVDAHAEASEWAALREVVARRGEGGRGIGIPTGGGAVLHPDGTVEALRHPLFEVVSGACGTVATRAVAPADAG